MYRNFLLNGMHIPNSIYIYLRLQHFPTTISVHFAPVYDIIRGLGSSVGIVTDYGLDSPGSNPGGDEIFRPSRPALGPTQSSVK